MASSKICQDQIDLDTVVYIFSQFNEDITNDCSEIINKLLKTLSVSVSLETKNHHAKVFASIKLLLNLYESLNSNTKSELPIKAIFENVKLIFECCTESCYVPENVTQTNVLSIISSVFKNGILQETSKISRELVEFYDYILTSLSKKECKSDCLIFKLKIITAIYQVLADSELNVGFWYQVRHEEIVNLTLQEDEKVAFQTLYHLIPAQVNCYKHSQIVEVIWKRISSCEMEHPRALMILCQIFYLSFDKFIMKDKSDLFWFIFSDENCWKLIQLALKDRDAVKRKQGFYLIKKAIDLLKSENRNVVCGSKKWIFYWDPDIKDELYKVYNEIIIILEFLEEQQIHIIMPVCNLINTVTETALSLKKVDLSWILLAYEKGLQHENLQIVKWAISNLLKLPKDFFFDESISKEIGRSLAVTLNNNSLYFNNSSTISKELKGFFQNVMKNIETYKTFFCAFIKELCSQVWSSEALFFVIDSFSFCEIPTMRYPFWGQDEISQITKFVLKAFTTHNKVIRRYTQINLSKACLYLTDIENVIMEDFIFLILIFLERNLLDEIWLEVVSVIQDFYPLESAKELLEKYLTGKSKYKTKYMHLMFFLFSDAYNIKKDSFALERFKKILASFKELHKRPYLNTFMHDENLSILCNIYADGAKYLWPEFIKPTLNFLKDIILYIQSQLSKILDLQDFNKLKLYLNTFKHIAKTLKLYKQDVDYIKEFYNDIVKDIELFEKSDFGNIGMYWRIKLLSIMLELEIPEVESSFLDFYILEIVNEPLIKDNNLSDKTRDLLTIWGKLNSEFLERKWKILKWLIHNKLVFHSCVKTEAFCWISNDDLVRLCIEALNTGGYGVLCPVMSILRNLLPDKESHMEVKTIIDSVWKLILERKKTEEFKLLVGQFVIMVFQGDLINEENPTMDILLEYVDIFFDSSTAVVNIFMSSIPHKEITKSKRLFCQIMGKALIYGPALKRDDRLTNLVCSYIEDSVPNFKKVLSESNRSSDTRAMAVQKITELHKLHSKDAILTEELIKFLMKTEDEISENRTRYFSNSHVHLVKLRVMQALLVLERNLERDSLLVQELSQWIIKRLLSESSQPSVRYMQEWLLIRMCVHHSKPFHNFNISRYFDGSEEIKKRGVCSLIGVTYHASLARGPVNADLTLSVQIKQKIYSDLLKILGLCFHRHFEIRLYAQVIFVNFFKNFKSNLGKPEVEQFQTVYQALKQYLEKEYQNNKIAIKLMNNFYIKNFQPIEDYCLEVIYRNLPYSTGVEEDECFTVSTLKCFSDSKKITIPIKSKNFPISADMWMWRTFEPLTPNDDDISNNFGDNYQKKIIPIKPGLNEDKNGFCENTVKNGELIVVASLIDRIPNLGGLARTCEVFGASEYVVNSQKCIANKQFTSLSVTAEKWITVKEVKMENLLDYVSEMKENGYTIIGAEQALHSQPLNSVKFPKKSLLLLGNEKEGIPPNLLSYLDICVEIPQLGVIRSLNVHVTGALFIWEYAKQHCFS